VSAIYGVLWRQCLTLSKRYSDDEYEYRHVQLPKAMLKAIPRDYFDSSKGTLKLLWEEEWRGLGITQVWVTAFSA
jgi:cyclin-dependent kinase regulatory subunit CKS1